MRRHELTANAIIQLPIIMVLAILLAATYPINIVLILTFYLCGLIDLTYSKLPLIRRGVFDAFGPQHIPTKRREAYCRGYKRIAIGAAFNVLALLHYAMIVPGL